MNPTVVARANANVALVKYFGKRDIPLNLPAAPSISLTLQPLRTKTTLDFIEGNTDEVFVSGNRADEKFAARISNYLNIFRAQSKKQAAVRVVTENNFPTAAGLASSASGFAALAAGAAKLYDLQCNRSELSVLARRGSGSAARSICSGIVKWERGIQSDGSDSFAHSIAPPDYWDLRILVGVTTQSPKEIGSTEAMERTRRNSPYYPSWIDATHAAAEEAVDAVKHKDFQKLGEITEHSALAMHAALMAARAPIVFLKGATLDVFHMTRTLQKSGIAAYFTCDAGPQPKILCQATDVDTIEAQLKSAPGIQDVIHCRLADGAVAEIAS